MNSSYDSRVAFPVDLASSTSDQLPGHRPALLVPLGATEQHGPHLPLATDTRIATEVASAARAGLPATAAQPWLLAPAIAYGASGEHEGFAGTVSIGTDALVLMLVEFSRSALRWASRLVFVNGHGGNVPALRSAVARLRSEGRDVGWCPCYSADSDAHAGHTETSVMLHLSGDEVAVDRWRRGNSAPLRELMPALRSGGVAAVSEVGVLGDPTTATAEQGERIFAEMVADCVRRITDWKPGADGMLV